MQNISGLESAKLKITRASVHLDAINRMLVDFASRNKGLYEIASDANGEETVQFLVGVPRDVLVVVGEIVYQLRSCLDHLAFSLVESNPGGVILPKNWEKRCEFPLHIDVPKDRNSKIPYSIPVPYAAFKDSLPGISKIAYTFIEGVQPYHGGAGIHNILRIIAKLSHIDKHRHLHVIIPRLAVHEHITYTSGNRGVSTVGGLKHGAEVPLPDELTDDPAVKVERSFTPYVTFDETIGLGPDTLESQNLLELCLKYTESDIIPAFEKLINTPKHLFSPAG